MMSVCEQLQQTEVWLKPSCRSGRLPPAPKTGGRRGRRRHPEKKEDTWSNRVPAAAVRDTRLSEASADQSRLELRESSATQDNHILLTCLTLLLQTSTPAQQHCLQVHNHLH